LKLNADETAQKNEKKTVFIIMSLNKIWQTSTAWDNQVLKAVGHKLTSMSALTIHLSRSWSSIKIRGHEPRALSSSFLGTEKALRTVLSAFLVSQLTMKILVNLKLSVSLPISCLTAFSVQDLDAGRKAIPQPILSREPPYTGKSIKGTVSPDQNGLRAFVSYMLDEP
jgi:hypothetical protein